MSLVEDLERRANSAREANLRRLKTSYHYARAKGFTSSEAQILQSHTTEYIDRVLAEKQAKERE